MALKNPELDYNPADFDDGEPTYAVPAPTPTPVSATGVMPVSDSKRGLSYNPAALAAAGFEGIEPDWTAYNRISLKVDGQFEDSNKKVIGKTFNCRFKTSKKQYIYRAVPNNPSDKTDLLYSYTAPDADKGSDLHAIKARIELWQSKNKGYEVKEYLEVLVTMEDTGEDVILSVSPTSKGRCSAHVIKAMQLTNGNPYEALTTVYVGEKIMGGVQPFFPWCFSFAK